MAYNDLHSKVRTLDAYLHSFKRGIYEYYDKCSLPDCASTVASLQLRSFMPHFVRVDPTKSSLTTSIGVQIKRLKHLTHFIV